MLTGAQLPLTTGTAWYYITCDILLISQYIYYSAKQARQRRHEERDAMRAAVRAAAYAANQSLREYEERNGSVLPALQSHACESGSVPPMLYVHSSPGTWLPFITCGCLAVAVYLNPFLSPH